MEFSIIIPAKNEEHNLKACFESLASIEYPADRFEVLLIDNGSTDSTVQVAESYGATVFLKPDLTISGLRNFGAAQAGGDILAFLDADCTVVPDWLTTADVWADKKEVCCFGGPPEIPDDATWVQKSWYLVREKSEQVTDVDWLESMNMFVRKDVFMAVAGFDESLTTCEDYDLSLRLQEHGRIVADKSVRAVHHGEAASVAHFYKKESWRGTSNLTGLMRHGFHLKELPSLLLPFIYVACALISVILLIGSLSGFTALFPVFAFWTLCWQCGIFLLAFKKGWDRGTLQDIGGLYLLLNIYFYARFRAMLRFA